MDDNVKELLVRFFQGISTQEVEKILLDWINEKPENLEYFNKERKLWDALLVNGFHEESGANDYGNFKELKERISCDMSQVPVTNEPERGIYSFRQVLKYAAVFLLGIFCCGMTLYVSNRNKQVLWNEVVIPKANRVQIILPDHTTVWLNSLTRFRYPEKFMNNKREVWLNGEAFFEVTKNPEKRFIVHTDKLDIEAWVTAFNVNEYDSEILIETTLVNGIVTVKSEQGNHILAKLKPNDLITFNKENSSVGLSQVDVDLFTCWKNGELKFRNERLVVIAQKLERYYNMHIIFNNDEIKNYRLTGAFALSEPYEKILAIIKKFTGTTYRINKNVAILEKTGTK